MEYLLLYTYEVSGRSGEGMNGYARVSHRELLAWERAMDIRLEPHERAAIRALDDALLHPEVAPEGEETKAAEPHRPNIPVLRKRPEGVEPQFVTPIPT